MNPFLSSNPQAIDFFIILFAVFPIMFMVRFRFNLIMDILNRRSRVQPSIKKAWTEAYSGSDVSGAIFELKKFVFFGIICFIFILIAILFINNRSLGFPVAIGAFLSFGISSLCAAYFLLKRLQEIVAEHARNLESTNG